VIAGSERASGILLHPTCLPGSHGIGDLGAVAYRFLDYLETAGQSLWQVLPLGPTGYGDSPYACFSSFAGNPLLVSPDILRDADLLTPEEIRSAPSFPGQRVDYGEVIGWKMPILRRAAQRFLRSARGRQRTAFESFRVAQSWWLRDYCLFMAIKRSSAGAWNTAWERDIALREQQAMHRCRQELAREIAQEEVIQFFFFSQWDALHAAAAGRGIRIIGDLPVFAAPDSADVWAHRDLFLLDGEGRPIAVSGVPPDYFAATGQLWGNPLYDWESLARQGFRFWMQRIGAARRLFDFIRIDHFRGFEACWSVPAGEPTAEHGRWVGVPGHRLFQAMKAEMGSLPIIAEDLGVITPEVNALRESFGFPGMRILQFAFDRAEAGALSPENRFLPHNHVPNSIVYTGTHDNDTTRGWWEKRTAEERDYLDRYAPSPEPDIHWRLIAMAMASVCRFAVIPLTDVLGLGSEARMNTPGTSDRANWSWRCAPDCFDAGTAARLRSLASLYGRLPIR
jgi:4-alpha-glucanotransferase